MVVLGKLNIHSELRIVAPAVGFGKDFCDHRIGML